MQIYLKNLSWLTLSFTFFFLDQCTKYLIQIHLQIGEVYPLFSSVNFTLAHNTGAAFSILADRNGWQIWALSFIAILSIGFLLIWLLRTEQQARLTLMPLALLLGGAFGNLCDRLRLGYVIDFIDFYIGSWHWYTFNIADIAITLGISMLLITLVKNSDTAIP